MKKHGQQRRSPLPPARGDTMPTCSCMNFWDGGDGLGRGRPGSKHSTQGVTCQLVYYGKQTLWLMVNTVIILQRVIC